METVELKTKGKMLEICGNEDSGDDIIIEALDEGTGAFFNVYNYNANGIVTVNVNSVKPLIKALNQMYNVWANHSEKEDRDGLVNLAVEQIKEDVNSHDYSAIAELLSFLPSDTLQMFVGE
jgi:hypothetical protein